MKARKVAVVAMQFTVSQKACAKFTSAFYQALDNKQPLDVAVAKGRLAITSTDSDSEFEGTTPVLFLRHDNGAILDLQPNVIPPKTIAIYNVQDRGEDAIQYPDYPIDLREFFDKRRIRDPKHWNGAIVASLRKNICTDLPQTNPAHFTMTAPLSVAYAAGFLLPTKDWRDVSIVQSGAVWSLGTPPPKDAATWLSEDHAVIQKAKRGFPLDPEAADLAVVVGLSRKAIGAVKKYLERADLQPPRVKDVVYAYLGRADQKGVRDGGHARALAEALMERLDGLEADYQTIHLFLAAPNGFAFALGRLGHSLGRVQLYEYDLELKDLKTYSPSICLTPPAMGDTP